MRIPRAILLLALCGVFTSLQSHGQLTENLHLSPQQWREDLRFFARELPKKHANAFHHISRDQFDAAVAELDGKLDHLDGDEVYVALDRIANMIGDGHTYVKFPRDDAEFPIDIARFGDQYRVTSVIPGLEKALGARVVQIEDTPIERAHDLIHPLTPQDETSQLQEANLAGYLTTGMVLHGLGIISNRRTARYTLADDSGQEFTIEVHAVSPLEQITPVRPFKDPPLFRQRPEESFWYTYLPESKTVYCNFRRYNDLGKYASGLLRLVNEQHPDKLVIDLRQNGGGDYTQGLKHLINPIRDLPAINKKGHLFVIIGPLTFSAAMSNAAQFRSETAAILVGQTIGEKPNSYQEPREMTLPNSRWTVRYSTRYYKFVESGENLVRPDQEIIPTWEDYKAGRDPALEWILKQPIP